MVRTEATMKKEVRVAMRGGPGEVRITHYFSSDEFNAPVRLCARIDVPVGAGIGLHDHVTEDEVYVILAGSGLLEEGNGPVIVKAGDAILTGRGASHAITNNGTTDLVLMAYISTYPNA